jgi:hypothetical protein
VFIDLFTVETAVHRRLVALLRSEPGFLVTKRVFPVVRTYSLDGADVNLFSVVAGDRLWGPPSLLQWVPGVERLGRVADHSPPTAAGPKKIWIYTSTSPYVLMT